MNAQPQTKTEDFVISRTFDAPRDLLWAAFTEADRLKEWFGPKGFSREATKLDFRVGGIHHYLLKAPDGALMWGKWVFREIEPLGLFKSLKSLRLHLWDESRRRLVSFAEMHRSRRRSGPGS